MTITKYTYIRTLLFILTIILHSCVPTKKVRSAKKTMPNQFEKIQKDTLNSASISWKEFFADEKLNALIDSALANNQELNIMLQQIEVAKNEIQVRKGEYLPFISYKAGAELEKASKFTRNGAVEENLPIHEEEAFPDPLPNYTIGLNVSWEIDIWKKLRNSKKMAVMEYLSSVEGKNFMITNLVAEIAETYYELIALDNQLRIIDQNLEIQQNALHIVKMQKQAARATELAVQRFEAELSKNKSERFEVKQKIVEIENRLNFLIGSQPSSIVRNSDTFMELQMDSISTGVPSELLINRPDIRRAEYELEAAKLNVKVARANFYPSFGIKAGIGLSAFNSKYLTSTPGALLYNLAGDLVGPLINRNAIKAAYNNANSRQLQTVYEYEKTILNAYIEVVNELSNIENLQKSFENKNDQVISLTRSIEISNKLFQSARADYMEVLLTQRDALEAKVSLVQTKKEQLAAKINLYRALGGGWR